LFQLEKLRVMEAIEAGALGISGVTACRHRMGGTGFLKEGREFAHMHGNGLLDVHLTKDLAEETIATRGAAPHHVLGHSSWVSFWIKRKEDVPKSMMLLQAGSRAN
jgi:hypothetical protein